MKPRSLLGWVCTGWLVAASACQPGLGHHLASHDVAFAFTQREHRIIAGLSTQAFRSAVWDRIDRSEFPEIASLMGHGEQSDVVDTQFHDKEAIIQVRTPDKRQYRIYMVYEEHDWFADDVLREVSPLQYASMRRQAEAVLAMRDFRKALSARDLKALLGACSSAFDSEVWKRLDPSKVEQAAAYVTSLPGLKEGPLGELFVARDGTWAARGQGAQDPPTFYFVSERGRLVVDDTSIPGSSQSLRVRLRSAVSSDDFGSLAPSGH
jgi:hypothetical protein